MSPRPILRSALLAALLFVLPLAAQEDSPLPKDSNNVYGKFDNGMAYIIRKCANPPDRVAMYVHVQAGSLHETRAQNGIAHFLEHMAFNGSKNYAPGELIPAMNELGMSFGAHSNAHTTRHETVYKLTMPGTSDEIVEKGFVIFSDFTNGLLLPQEEIDRERQVILEEARTRKSVGQRIGDALLPKLYPETQFAIHTVIGTEESINGMPRPEFVDFWNTWYRPELMTLIVVGDIDPQKMIEMGKKHLGEFKGRAPAREYKGTGIAPVEKARAIILSDVEMPAASLQMVSIQEGRSRLKTFGDFRFNEVENMGTWILSRRLQNLQQKGEASYMQAGASVAGIFEDAIQPSALAAGMPNNWKEMLTQLVVEVKRAVEHGFNESELGLAKDALLSSAERAVETEATWNASTHINRLSGAVGLHDPIMSAQQTFDILKKALPTVMVEDVNRVFKTNYGGGNFTYILVLPERDDVKLPTDEEVLAVAAAAWDKQTEGVEEEKVDVTILEKLPEPGTIVSQETDDVLGITTVKWSNGAILHHRFMDYKKDSVTVQVTMPGGQLQETADNRGVSMVAGLANATSRLSSIQIRDLMTTKKVGVSGGVGQDAVSISISGSPSDLESGLQLAYAELTDGKIEQSAFDTWKDSMHQQLEALKTSIGGQLGLAVQELIFPGDPRFTMITMKNIEKLSPAAGEAWMKKLTTKAPMEIAVVGDLSLEETLKLCGRYLASLPKADRDFKSLDALRTVKRQPGPYVKAIEVETITPQAAVLAGFIGCNAKDLADNRKLHLAAQVINERMHKVIREEKQLVYGIGCRNQAATAIPDTGLFVAQSTTDPERVDELANIIIEMLKEFAKNGPTDEELEVARKQIANGLETNMKEPAFWLRVMGDLEYRGRTLASLKELPGVYSSFSKEEIQATAAKYFKDERMIKVTAVPKKADE